MYMGEWFRAYTPIEKRDDVVEGDDLGELEPSAAYRRRIAGKGWF
jgi:hypothetical protein